MRQSYVIMTQKKLKIKILKRHWNQVLQITLLSKLKKNYLTGKMSNGITNFQTETALKILTMKI